MLDVAYRRWEPFRPSDDETRGRPRWKLAAAAVIALIGVVVVGIDGGDADGIGNLVGIGLIVAGVI